MRKLFAIRVLLIFSCMIALKLLPTRCAHAQTNNPLRMTQPAAEFHAPDFLSEKGSVVLPTAWQEPASQEALPPATLAPAIDPPPAMMPETWNEEPWTAPPQEAELYWPDEEYGSDPNMPRSQRMGPARRRLQMMGGLLGIHHTGRFTGFGEPLTNSSWLNRPWSFGGFVGTQMHDDLLAGQIGQSNSAVGGGRLGWDFNYYWGLEARFAYSNPDTFIPGIPSVIGSSHNYYVDLNLMYYPWGDSRWRPFFSVGLGSGTYRFRGEDISVSDSGLRVPLTLGLKYFYSPWFTLRFDAQYAPTFNSGNFDTQNEFMFTMGAEVRFGGRRQSYFPWSSSTAYW